MMSQGATQPAAPATQPAAPAALTPQQEQLQRFNRAYYAYLANPDMPLDPSESTGTLRGDQQALARARAARMMAAGQAAVAERAQAQGRLQGTDPVTGAPIVGAATAAPIVQESPGGVRVAYRNGVPVGFSTPQPTAARAVTPTALMPQEAAAVRQEATRLAADQSAARMRAAQILRAAGATAPAVAAAQAAPVAVQAAAPAPVSTSPVTRPVNVAPVEETVAEEPEPTTEEVMTQAQQFLQQEPIRAERQQVEQQRTTYEQQVLDLTRRLNQATISGNAPEVARLQGMLAALRVSEPAKTVEETRQRTTGAEERARQARLAAMGQAMFRGVMPPQ